METKTCPACGAPIDGNKCEFCGWVYSAKQESNQGEAVENKEITTPLDDMLSDKFDFLAPDGQLKLGFAYLNGVGVPKNEEKAVELFAKSALGGNVEGIFQYAEALNSGRGIKQDKKVAVLYYIQAANMGHIGARMRLGEFSDAALNMVSDDKVIAQTGASGGFENLVSRIRPFCVEFTCCNGNVPASQGSGCVIADGKIVITNAHVVMDVQSKELKVFDNIYISFESKYDKKRYQVEVVVVEPKEDIALCVFKNDMPNLLGVSPKLVKDYGYCVGKEVFTIGNGLGRGLGLSRGVISKDLEKNCYGYREVIRTDMSINPGNSGGALFDLNGNIIGMMTFVAKQRNNELAYGMSYAITSNTIIELIRQISEQI